MLYVPKVGDRVRHQARGDGEIIKIDDHQYCHFKPDNCDDVCYVCQDNLSKITGV
jgi:hypothetical protein